MSKMQSGIEELRKLLFSEMTDDLWEEVLGVFDRMPAEQVELAADYLWGHVKDRPVWKRWGPAEWGTGNDIRHLLLRTHVATGRRMSIGIADWCRNALPDEIDGDWPAYVACPWDVEEEFSSAVLIDAFMNAHEMFFCPCLINDLMGDAQGNPHRFRDGDQLGGITDSVNSPDIPDGCTKHVIFVREWSFSSEEKYFTTVEQDEQYVPLMYDQGIWTAVQRSFVFSATGSDIYVMPGTSVVTTRDNVLMCTMIPMPRLQDEDGPVVVFSAMQTVSHEALPGVMMREPGNQELAGEATYLVRHKTVLPII